MRLRILVGTAFLVVGLAVYGVIVMAVAVRLPPQPVLAFGFYALAGIAWVLPAGWLTRWMQQAAPFRQPPEG